jgi:hypothetical protein
MRAADQWAQIEETLDADWAEARLSFAPEGSASEAAAVLGPMQPVRVGVELRFRASGKRGYGVSPQMARRCFERMDAEGITGRIAVLYGLSDTENADTQGPVWRLAGRSV